jgi:hypothetical protein
MRVYYFERMTFTIYRISLKEVEYLIRLPSCSVAIASSAVTNMGEPGRNKGSLVGGYKLVTAGGRRMSQVEKTDLKDLIEAE